MRTAEEIRRMIEKLETVYDDPKYKGQYLGFSESMRYTQASVLRWVLGDRDRLFTLPPEVDK